MWAEGRDGQEMCSDRFGVTEGEWRLSQRRINP